MPEAISPVVDNKKPESTAHRLKTSTKKLLNQEITSKQALKLIINKHRQQDAIGIKKLEGILGIKSKSSQSESTPILAEDSVVKDDYFIQKEKEYFNKEGNLFKYAKDRMSCHDRRFYLPYEDIPSISTFLKLKKSGVDNPTKFYKVLRHRSFDKDEITNQDLINSYKGISPEKIAIGIDRLEFLGLGYIDTHSSKSKEIVSALADIPIENFNNVVSQLDHFPFLNESQSLWSIPQTTENKNSFIDGLLSDFKNGYLDPQTKNKLDFMNNMCVLKKSNYVTDDFLRNTITVIGKSKNHTEDFDGGWLLDMLDKNNKISFGPTMDIKAIDENILDNNLKYFFKKIDGLENIDTFINQLSPDRINKLLKSDDFKTQEKVIFSIYRSNLKKDYSLNNSDDIKDLFSSKNLDFSRYLDQDNKLNSSLFETLVKEDIQFNSSFLSDENMTNFSPEDQIFWSAYKNIISIQPDSYQLRNFIIENKSDFSKFLDQDNKLNSSLFETLVKEDIQFNSSFLSDENITNFSPEDKVSWTAYRNIINFGFSSEINSFFLENKLDFSKFIDQNNKPNSLLYESVFKKTKNISYHLRSDEKLKHLPPKDKIFWKSMFDKYMSHDKKICSYGLAKKLVDNKNILIKDASDSTFIDNIFNQYSKKAEGIVNGYIDCISAGVISPSEKNLVSDFLKDFKIISPTIISEYKKAVDSNTRDIFISHLKEMTQKMTSSKSLDKSDREKPYFTDLIKHVYPNNVGHYTTYESNDSCQDKSGDLGEFKIEDVYQIDLLSQGVIKVKENQTLDENIPMELQNQIINVMEKLQSFGFDKDKSNQYLEGRINEQLARTSNPDINLKKVTSTEDRLFLLITESIYGSSPIDKNVIKELMITYQFTKYEDIRNFIKGTTDVVNTSSNKDYALLCQLHNFYSNRIKDVNKRIVESASKNKTIIDLMPKYFQQENRRQSELNVKSSIDKSRIDKLGLAPSFIDQITRTLNQRIEYDQQGQEKQHKYTSEEVTKLIYDYEEATQGLSLEFPSDNKNTAAFAGQLRAQREKTFNTARTLGQKDFDPLNIHLGEINLQQLIDSQNKIKKGEYNQEQFISYTAQKFMDVFSDEVSKITIETGKFISESGTTRELLNGYITKSKESANARMVGGVCVSGDNPDKGKKNMWNIPEYFQFVFQDPDNLQCQGLVLMHHYIEKGKKVLAVSLNPSSTYLYSVDESALFKGILSQLETFASENKFDYIVTSQNNTIRTNRTGGKFEEAIDNRVREVGESFKFSKPKNFSHKPSYSIQDMDIIWKSATV